MHFPGVIPSGLGLRREVQAIQHFGQNRLESISEGEIILAEARSAYSRMIEAVRQERRYLILERDLRERAEPTARIEDGDAAESAWTRTPPLAGDSPT